MPTPSENRTGESSLVKTRSRGLESSADQVDLSVIIAGLGDLPPFIMKP